MSDRFWGELILLLIIFGSMGLLGLIGEWRKRRIIKKWEKETGRKY